MRAPRLEQIIDQSRDIREIVVTLYDNAEIKAKIRAELEPLLNDQPTRAPPRAPVFRPTRSTLTPYVCYCSYVRMQAEWHGIQLIGEQQNVPTQKMHIPSRVAPREYKSSVPKGVHTGRRRDR